MGAAAATTANTQGDSAEDVDGESESPAPAVANLNETLLVFPSNCDLGSKESVTVLGNGSNIMLCRDGKCELPPSPSLLASCYPCLSRGIHTA